MPLAKASCPTLLVRAAALALVCAGLCIAPAAARASAPGISVVQLRELPDPLLRHATAVPAAPAGATGAPPPWASFVALVDGGDAPSVQGAVGPNHVVVMTARYLRVLSRSGDVRHTVAVRDLAGVESGWDGRFSSLAHDAYRDRFVAAVVVSHGETGSRRLRLLASQGADPMGSWTAREVDALGLLSVDRPRLAVTAKLVLLHGGQANSDGTKGYTWFFDAAAVGNENAADGRMTSTSPRMAPAMVPIGEEDRAEFLAWNPGAGTALVRYAVPAGATTAKLLSITNLVALSWSWSDTPTWPDAGASGVLALTPFDGIARGMVRGDLSWWVVPNVGGYDGAPGCAWFAVAESGQIVHKGHIAGGLGGAVAYPSLAVSPGLAVLVGFVHVNANTFLRASYGLHFGWTEGETQGGEYGYFDGAKACPGSPGCTFGPWSATVLDPARPDLLWTFQPVALASGASTTLHGVAVAAVATPCGKKTCGGCERCDAGNCVALGDGTPCFDGLPCTEDDRCQSGTCSGKTKTCGGAGPCHEAGGCDSATGACKAAAINEGKTCDDGNPCTVQDRCAGGGCLGAPRACPAQDACHRGYCEQATGTCRTAPTYATACLSAAPAQRSGGGASDGGCGAGPLGGGAWGWTVALLVLTCAHRRRR